MPQSRELSAFTVLAAAVGGFWVMGGWFSQHATAIVRHGLTFSREAAVNPQDLAATFLSLSLQGLLMATPLFVLTIAAAIATPFAIGGWVFAPNVLSVKFERIDPIKGFGRMFSWHSVGELVKAVLKAALIGGVIYWVVSRQQDHLFSLMTQPVDLALASFGRMVIFAALALVGGLAVIAAIDVPFQLWRHYRDLRMTREELRQELKELEGDPQLKARIRSQQREIARRRMMTEVPKADVVVTNPTHFAVALRYDSDSMGAPQVVAKGMNLVAQRIRELAEEHRVPVLEAPPLARALYRHSDLGDQIPAALYTAVAEVMAYVYQLNQYFAGSGAVPSVPQDIPVPAELDPGVAA